MTKNNVRTIDQVAALYGVHRTTVYRWVRNNAFDVAPTIVPSPSRQRDRVLFDSKAVVKQFRKDVPPAAREAAADRLKEFVRG